jgi:hypothetical protein
MSADVRLELAKATAEVAALTAERDRLREERDAATADAERMRIAAALYGVGIDPEGYYADTPGARARELLYAEAERDTLAAQLARAETVIEAALADVQSAPNAVADVLIEVRPEDSVREGWHRATCNHCGWTTTGLSGVCDDAGHEHAVAEHPLSMRIAEAAVRYALLPLRVLRDAYQATPATTEREGAGDGDPA